MAPTKNEILRRGGVTGQDALVKQLQDQKVIKPLRRDIPGGQTLAEKLGGPPEELQAAVYAWLRGVAGFEEVRISFAAEPKDYDVSVEKVVDFGHNPKRRPWETHARGRKWLAEEVADVMTSYRFVFMDIKDSGIYIGRESTPEFGPTRPAEEPDVEQYAQMVEDLKAFAEENDDDWEDPEMLELGDPVPNEEWKPHLVIIPTRKRQYGRSS